VVRRSGRVEQASWWCGLIAVALIGAGFFAIDEGGTTDADGPIGVLVSEVVGSRGRIIVGSLVGMTGALLLIWFASGLRMRLASEGDTGVMIGLAAFGSGVLMSAGALAHGSFRLAETSVAGPVLEEAMRPLAILGSHVTDVLGWGMIGLVVAISVAGFAVRLIPIAVAAVGAVLSVAALVLSPTSHGAAAVALQPWLLVACVILLVDRPRAQVAPSGP
jgi:hypothetical protein